MASRFESTYQARVLPAAFRAFGHDIDLISADDSTEYRLTAMVDMDEIPSGEGFSDVQGRITVKTADLFRYVETVGPVTKARVKGKIFDVYGEALEHCGLTKLNVRRKYEEQQHTNIYDIDGEQAVWHEAE